MKRKEFLATGLAGGIGAFLPGKSRGETPVPGRVKNIIFFGFDGFSWEDYAAVFHYNRRNGEKPLHIERLFAQGSAGSVMTHSMTSMVTDSSAATAAWATGRKIINGYLSEYPDGHKLTTILDLAKDQGRAVGVVSTTRVTHATPAGWIAKHQNRRAEENIAVQFADFKADVMMGGGVRAFDPQQRSDEQDLYKPFRDAGYDIVTNTDELDSITGNRVLATCTHSHIPFAIDRVFREQNGPSLDQMTSKSLEILNGSDSGFVLHVEAGRIDHANHANDAAAAMWEMLEADSALGVMMKFADQHPDTLLIMASDHGTGGGAVYGVGERYRAASEIHDLIKKPTCSFEYLVETFGETPTENEIRELIRETHHIVLCRERAVLIQEAFAGSFDLYSRAAFPRQPMNAIGYALKGGTNDNPTRLNVNYATGQHTAGAVPAAIYCKGITPRSFGLIDNTDLFYRMTEALGITYENQEMSAEQAMETMG
jgi:alkaline phosphatase